MRWRKSKSADYVGDSWSRPMKSKTGFINGGGWIVHETIGRPKARFFASVSVVWCLVCAFAGMLLCLSELSLFYHWMCICLVAMEPLFIVLAVVFAFIEKPRILLEYLANPDHDAHNLY